MFFHLLSVQFCNYAILVTQKFLIETGLCSQRISSTKWSVIAVMAVDYPMPYTIPFSVNGVSSDMKQLSTRSIFCGVYSLFSTVFRPVGVKCSIFVYYVPCVMV